MASFPEASDLKLTFPANFLLASPSPSPPAHDKHTTTTHLFGARVAREHGHKRVLVESVGQHTLREQRRDLHGGAHEAPVVGGLLRHAPLDRRG
jgi:hypothetical protein